MYPSRGGACNHIRGGVCTHQGEGHVTILGEGCVPIKGGMYTWARFMQLCCERVKGSGIQEEGVVLSFEKMIIL